MRIELNIGWTVTLAPDRRHDVQPLLRLLDAVLDKGSLAEAARSAGWSYRHAWGMVGEWEALLGAPLIVRGQGRPAMLTAIGHKLVGTQKRFTQQLEPLVQMITNELNRELEQHLASARS